MLKQREENAQEKLFACQITQYIICINYCQYQKCCNLKQAMHRAKCILYSYIFVNNCARIQLFLFEVFIFLSISAIIARKNFLQVMDFPDLYFCNSCHTIFVLIVFKSPLIGKCIVHTSFESEVFRFIVQIVCVTSRRGTLRAIIRN